MLKNIGYADKGARFFGGTILGIAGYTWEPRDLLNAILLVLAIYLFATALGGVCFFYYLLGVSTRRKGT